MTTFRCGLHRITPENTYTAPQGWRTCRECKRAAGRRYTKKLRDNKRDAEAMIEILGYNPLEANNAVT